MASENIYSAQSGDETEDQMRDRIRSRDEKAIAEREAITYYEYESMRRNIRRAMRLNKEAIAENGEVRE